MTLSKPILLISILLSVTGCKQAETIPEQAVQCPKERPEICTRHYQPACGYHSATSFKTYSNSCTACTDPKVQAVIEGSCPNQ